MKTKSAHIDTRDITINSKIDDYKQLIKLKLNLFVVFSAAFGYTMASNGSFNFMSLFLISLGGFLVVSASNGLNQVIERNYDKLMTRTENRPVATGRMSVTEASIVSLLLGICGVLILGIYFNKLTGILALSSLAIYAFVYTPLKRIHSINVFVGAIPGAMPPVLGYVAVTHTLDYMCVVLFLVQFLWQFVHFLSIAWILDDDYKKAGFKMLPSSGRSKLTAFKIILYALLLIPVAYMPFYLGKTGIISVVLSTLTVFYMLYRCFNLYKTCDNKEARQVMFSSYFYLTITQIVFILDKI
jgi:protoheme IX farnesyltransferase